MTLPAMLAAMPSMTSPTMPINERMVLLAPELLLLLGAVAVSVLGLSKRPALRGAVPLATMAALAAAFAAVLVVHTPERAADAGLPIPMLGLYARGLIAAIGIGLVAIGVGSVDRRLEDAFAAGRAAFDPIRVTRGEFHAFLLFSLAGAMLVTTAPDLIWLFLAIELSSLPTYIMVAMGRASRKAQEAAVKYFFLGAMSTALMLFGFALLYGAAGSMQLEQIAGAMLAGGLDSPLAVAGAVFAILGIAFKIAAVPMHFYAPDVYEGASIPVTSFLSFTPKVTGLAALMALLASIGWSPSAEDARLSPAIAAMLWMIAVLTMTLGNIGALLQRSVKRMMAYSSISHSGYMLVGIVAGPAAGGYDAVLFYLLAYAATNLAIFGALASIERRGEEVDDFDSLAGLRLRHPAAAATLAIGAGSLIGLPPLLGFWGKLDLFIAGLDAGQVALVVIMAVNSAVSAWYYLRLAGLPTIAAPGAEAEGIVAGPSRWPLAAAVVGGACVVLLPFAASSLVDASAVAGPPPASAEASVASAATVPVATPATLEIP